MPGFDGTGPLGQGPMTGWGRGYCALPVQKTAPYPPAYGLWVRSFFLRPGLGLGFRRGWAGRGRRFWW